MDEKSCYIKLDIEEDNGLTLVLIDKFYARVSLGLADDGEPICVISGNDDWELAYFGSDAEAKFNSLLSWAVLSTVAVPFDYITDLGFTSWG